MLMWQEKHERVVNKFLEYLNFNSKDFILKDNTALFKGYGLDRFSENIYLDAQQGSSIREIIDSFCVAHGYKYKEEKNIVATEKYTMQYHHDSKPIEISVSFRAIAIDKSLYINIGNVLIYKLNPLLKMKIATYMCHNEICDLYDIAFICNRHFESLSPETILQLENMLEYKGLEHFDYLMDVQEDELINTEKLKFEFLNMCNKLEIQPDDN